MSQIKSKYYHFLGICKRAGELISGYDSVTDTFDKVQLIIIAEDASDRVKERIELRCKQNQVPLIIYGSSIEYGKALGTKPTVLLAVLDKNFTKALMSKFGNGILFGGEQFGKNKSL